jgi:hypothetical protein
MTDEEASDPQETKLHLAYAEASVMLLECLMIVLVERKLVPLDTLVDAVETAIEAKRSQVRDHSHPEIAGIAAGVLSKIANSLAATGHGGDRRNPEST